jgi:hypothetical protein
VSGLPLADVLQASAEALAFFAQHAPSHVAIGMFPQVVQVLLASPVMQGPEYAAIREEFATALRFLTDAVERGRLLQRDRDHRRRGDAVVPDIERSYRQAPILPTGADLVEPPAHRLMAHDPLRAYSSHVAFVDSRFRLERENFLFPFRAAVKAWKDGKWDYRDLGVYERVKLVAPADFESRDVIAGELSAFIASFQIAPEPRADRPPRIRKAADLDWTSQNTPFCHHRLLLLSETGRFDETDDLILCASAAALPIRDRHTPGAHALLKLLQGGQVPLRVMPGQPMLRVGVEYTMLEPRQMWDATAPFLHSLQRAATPDSTGIPLLPAIADLDFSAPAPNAATPFSAHTMVAGAKELSFVPTESHQWLPVVAAAPNPSLTRPRPLPSLSVSLALCPSLEVLQVQVRRIRPIASSTP